MKKSEMGGVAACLMAMASAGWLGCGGDGESNARTAEHADAAGADATAVNIDLHDVPWAVPLAVNLEDMERQRSGLYIQVLAEGQGPAAAEGDSMRVHYTLWLPDGKKIDSSYDHDPPEPLAMKLGTTPLIPGWVEGVWGMRPGEKRRLVLPYNLAYGPAGNPGGIPPYSPLLFEVEVTAVQPAGR